MNRLRFQDGDRHLDFDLEGPVVVVPTSLRVVSRGGGETVVEPIRSEFVASGEPDVLVGRLPLHIAKGREVCRVDINLPAPPPFAPDAVETMWQAIRDTGCPVPTSVSAQGRLLPGKAMHHRMAGIDLDQLARAHAICRALIGRWPEEEVTRTRWRRVELAGGREDAVRTEREGGRWAIGDVSGRALPERTARRYSAAAPWTSNALALAAKSVVESLSPYIDSDGSKEKTTVLGPIAGVSRLARSTTGERQEPPLSSWPPVAAQAFRLLRAVLSDLVGDPAGRATAPLSLLWRLYEAWVASQIWATVTNGSSEVLSEPARARGCEWWARASNSDNGASYLVVSQAEITEDPASCSPLAEFDLRSVSSTLRPDVVVVREMPGEDARVRIYDAKKRRTEMDASSVSEAAGKYLWGIRKGPANIAALDRAVVVATDGGAPMFDKELSRTESIGLRPDMDTDAALTMAVM